MQIRETEEKALKETPLWAAHTLIQSAMRWWLQDVVEQQPEYAFRAFSMILSSNPLTRDDDINSLDGSVKISTMEIFKLYDDPIGVLKLNPRDYPGINEHTARVYILSLVKKEEKKLRNMSVENEAIWQNLRNERLQRQAEEKERPRSPSPFFRPQPGQRMNNHQQLTLNTLSDLGLTENHLLNLITYDYAKKVYFGPFHRKALDFLLTKKNFPLDDALDEVREMTSDQASALVRGWRKAQIYDLNNEQIRALEAFKDQGLTRERLLELETFNDEDLPEFNWVHLDAMMFLVFEKKFSIDEAFARMRRLTTLEAEEIVEGIAETELVRGGITLS